MCTLINVEFYRWQVKVTGEGGTINYFGLSTTRTAGTKKVIIPRKVRRVRRENDLCVLCGVKNILLENGKILSICNRKIILSIQAVRGSK